MTNGERLGEVEIRHGIFQNDLLPPLLFVLLVVSLTTILNKMNCGYELAKKGVKKSHLPYIYDLKLLEK